jgi:hypothetical protein
MNLQGTRQPHIAAPRQTVSNQAEHAAHTTEWVQKGSWQLTPKGTTVLWHLSSCHHLMLCLLFLNTGKQGRDVVH